MHTFRFFQERVSKIAQKIKQDFQIINEDDRQFEFLKCGISEVNF